MRVAIIENTGVTHHGQVGVALAEAGVLWDVFRPYVNGVLPKAEGYDGLIAFGGEQSALDDARHPYLPELSRLLRGAGEAGKAVLGICLGAQILARGYGAKNELGAVPEFGWSELQLTEAGRTDPVLGMVEPRFRTFQWHSDTFTLPPGAMLLARGESVAHQAFRLGEKVYGTQFHFEANRAVVAHWSRAFADQTEALSPGWSNAHPKEADTHGSAADASGLALARAWVRLL